ncbi:hypothetical protein MYX78_01100, partial [Acidobacteria bacterium AH-259-G07]|nr:hypothetical protein [Acidobacteria bacterium AH-259-G07]
MDFMYCLQLLGHPKLRSDSNRYLRTHNKTQDNLRYEENIRRFAQKSRAPLISPGIGGSGHPIEIPLDAFHGHGLICGATGSGKSFSTLSLMLQLVQIARRHSGISFGLIDAKGELFEKFHQALDHEMSRLGVAERAMLEKKVKSLNFSNASHPVPYNLLKSRQGESPELLVQRRMEVFNDVIGREGHLSLRMSRMLRYFLLLALEFDLSFPLLEFLFTNTEVTQHLAYNSKNLRLKSYFATDFPRESTTLLALSQRLDFLLHNEAVRLSFGADSAVDFQDLMDRGVVVMINCGGPSTPRALSRIIQSLLLSDLRQAIFSRTKPQHHYTWFIDEAQCLFSQSADTENLSSILSMSRSYGTHLVLITQSLLSAIPDREFFTNLETNFRWLLLFRSGLQDAQIVRPAIPCTGRVIRQRYGRGRLSYMSPEQEIRHRLREVANLPPQNAYFWLRGANTQAIQIRSHHLRFPQKQSSLLHRLLHEADAQKVKRSLEQQENQLANLISSPTMRKVQKKATVY